MNADSILIQECQIVKVRALNHDVTGVWLRPFCGSGLSFKAGQYIEVLLDNDTKRSYSIASAPRQATVFELHIRQIAKRGFADALLTRLREGEKLTIRGPYGTAGFLGRSNKPAILIAGSTGLAPIKSMVEDAIAQNWNQDLYIYWGVRAKCDLYLHDLLLNWANDYAYIRYVPVLSAPADEDRWTGRVGWVHVAVLQDFADLSGMRVYASGPLAMVHAIRDEFLTAGLPSDQLHSDLL